MKIVHYFNNYFYEETEPCHSCMGMSARYGRSVSVDGFGTGTEGLYQR